MYLQGVGVYIGEHVFESGIAHTDEWEECLGWQRGVLECLGLIFLAPLLWYDLISGQAVAYSAVGDCVGPEAKKRRPECTNHCGTMGQTWRTENTPFIIWLCPSV